MSGVAQKGNIVKATKPVTNGYDDLSSRPTILAEFTSAEIIGTFQGFHKNSAGTVFAKVKLSKPVTNGWFGWEYFGKTYTDAFFLLSDVSIFANTDLGDNVAYLQRAVCTANGVRLRKQPSLNSGIITVFNRGDIIGLSDFSPTNDFVKVALTNFIEKDGQTIAVGYIHKDFVKVAGQADIEVADGSTGNSVADVATALARQDSTPENGYYNRYNSTLLWTVFLAALGVLLFKFRNKKNGQTKIATKK